MLSSSPAPSPLEVLSSPHQASALLHDTRRQLLSHLAEPDSAAGLARKVGLPRQRLNDHLRTLERNGLVEFVKSRRKGNCVERLLRAKAHAFVISPEALQLLGTTPEAAGDRYSAASLMSAAAQTIREVATLESRARGGQADRHVHAGHGNPVRDGRGADAGTATRVFEGSQNHD
jgi:DNA-binding transcriptional ArsR family regulator